MQQISGLQTFTLWQWITGSLPEFWKVRSCPNDEEYVHLGGATSNYRPHDQTLVWATLLYMVGCLITGFSGSGAIESFTPPSSSPQLTTRPPLHGAPVCINYPKTSALKVPHQTSFKCLLNCFFSFFFNVYLKNIVLLASALSVVVPSVLRSARTCFF